MKLIAKRAISASTILLIFIIYVIIFVENISTAEQIEDKRRTIYLLGDSVMATVDDKYYPRVGWGAGLYQYFIGANWAKVENIGTEENKYITRYELPDFIIENHAKPSQSSKSVLNNGMYDKILAQVKEGDYIIISFGHNDSRRDYEDKYTKISEYMTNIETIVGGLQEKGGTCILVSPIPRYSFSQDGTSSRFFVPYRAGMKYIADKMDCLYIELGESLEAHFNIIGPKATKEYYMILDKGVFENYPNGRYDASHLTEYGSHEFMKKFLRMMQTEEKAEEFNSWIDKSLIFD